MRLLSLIFCFLCMAWPLLAIGEGCQPSSMITNDILECVNASYVAMDKKLNNQYKVLVLNTEPSLKKLVVNSQRAWLTYRDAHCDAVYESVSPGEEAGIERVSCLASMTSSRLTEMIYIETGVLNGSFYSSLSVMSKFSSKKRNEIIDFINGEILVPEGVEYFRKNCELTEFLYKENVQSCNARIKIQDI